MDIQMTELGGAVVLEPADELDLLGYQDLARKLEEVLRDGGRTIIIDLDRVTYVNASVVRVLLAANEKVKGAKGKLALARARGGTVAMLEAAGALRAMKAYDSVQDAMVALGVV